MEKEANPEQRKTIPIDTVNEILLEEIINLERRREGYHGPLDRKHWCNIQRLINQVNAIKEKIKNKIK